MPKVRRVQIPQQDTVDRALHRGIVDLLPAQLAENELVRWVVAFDATLKTRRDEGDDRFLFRDDPEHMIGTLLGRMGSGLLQSRIPFYFASVFHIGRMIVVSAESLERVGVLREPSNLDTSVGKITTSFSNQKDLPQGLPSRDQIRQALLDGCDEASTRQRKQAELANRWGERWQTEVGDLRKAMDEIEHAWRYRNESQMAAGVIRLWQPTATGSLQAEMARSGVQFKNLEASSMGTGWNLVESKPFLLLAACALSGGRDVQFEIRELVWRWLDVERAKAEESRRRVDHEKSEIALQLLQRKYVGANPFDQFGVGIAAATPRLRDLVKEHSLPDGTASPWRQVWQQQLTVIESYQSPLVGSGGDDEQLRDWCFRTADSAIKESIGDSWAKELPWNAFVQKLFERKWILMIAKMARNANKAAESKADKWAISSLYELFSHAVEDLNKIGYELGVPSSERLESLMKKLESGAVVYDSAEW